MRPWLFGLFCLAAAGLWPASAPDAQPANSPPEEVDVALVLAVDVSYSMASCNCFERKASI